MTAASVGILSIFAGPSNAGELSFTDFEGFSTDTTVDGQDGWTVVGNFDEKVVDDGSGNIVWRVSNAVTSGAFGNQPFAPCPGGVPSDIDLDGAIEANNGTGDMEAVDNSPDSFAGETSTEAVFARFFAEFNFTAATASAQPGLSITVSADNWAGARQSFIDIEDNGNGLNIISFDVNRNGRFGGPITIAQGLSYADWHTFAVEVVFREGDANDIVRYFVDGKLVHTNGSWEQFYQAFQASLHPDGVPVQTLLFRLSGADAPGLNGDGLYVDNVFTAVTAPMELPLEPGLK